MTVLVAHRPLGKQAQRALQYMIERGGITRKEAIDIGIANLPAEVGRIRAAFGNGAVVTDMWPPDGDAQYAVYRWRGSIEPQTELFTA